MAAKVYKNKSNQTSTKSDTSYKCDSCKDLIKRRGSCISCAPFKGKPFYSDSMRSCVSFKDKALVGQSLVDHPSHYNVGGIEVIDFIEAWELNFSLGSAVKYIARAPYKGKQLEDLRKAAWYINREIARIEKQG
jgi:hypothetical protein